VGAGGSADFYADLPAFRDFTLACDPRAYWPVPDDWAVAITDVKGSTKAIEAGRYKHVNAIGAASIVAVLNAIGRVPIPYVFGGDGATVIVPRALLPQVERALRGVRRLAREGFDLELRIGAVPVGELRADGFSVGVARFQSSPTVSFAMMSGAGLTEAERRIKDPELGPRYAIPDDGQDQADASFDGFECRWQPVESQRGEMVSILVQARTGDLERDGGVYRAVVERVAKLMGSADGGRPVSETNLVLSRDLQSVEAEARIVSGGYRTGLAHWLARARAWFLTFMGRLLMGTGLAAGGFDGKRYRGEVIDNTDYRKFDDTLRMVLDLPTEVREKLERFLEGAHRDGLLDYGVHVSKQALMTCVVFSHAGDHVHFLDGGDGGYAMAAKQLKAQRRQAA
jgi:hypothetical protein